MPEITSGDGKSTNQILAALLSNIPSLTYGIQIGWMSPNERLLRSTLTPSRHPYTDIDVSWMASGLSIGAIAGVMIFMYLSDRCGRKISIILLSILSAISWTIKIISAEPSSLITARIIAGVAAGGTWLTVPIYSREIAQDSIRGALGSFSMLLCNVGVIIAYGFGILLTYYQSLWIYLAITFSHMLIFVLMPESPPYLLKKGLQMECSKVIAWLRSVHCKSEVVSNEMTKLKDAEAKVVLNVTFKSIVEDRATVKALQLSFVIFTCQRLSGGFALVTYAGAVFANTGSDWSPDSLAIFVGTVQLVASIVSTFTIEKFGRKLLLGGSFILVSISLAVLASWFLLAKGNIHVPQWLPVTAVCASIFFYAIGIAPVSYVVITEIFSYQHRAKLSGYIMLTSWFLTTLSVLFFKPISNTFGDDTLFYIFAVVNLVGGAYTLLLMPETMGKSLEQIQRDLIGFRKTNVAESKYSA